MKTLSQNAPTFFPHGPESRSPQADTYLVKLLVPLMLIAVLFSGALWYLLTLPSRVTPTSLEPRLELSLSGAYTSNLSLGGSDLKQIQCGPSSFSVASTSGAVTPLTLSFNGRSFNGSSAQRSQNSSFFVTGAGNDIRLTLAGTPYTFQSGNVTVQSGIRTFYASFTDAQGQPLELSGRLVCP